MDNEEQVTHITQSLKLIKLTENEFKNRSHICSKSLRESSSTLMMISVRRDREMSEQSLGVPLFEPPFELGVAYLPHQLNIVSISLNSYETNEQKMR